MQPSVSVAANAGTAIANIKRAITANNPSRRLIRNLLAREAQHSPY